MYCAPECWNVSPQKAQMFLQIQMNEFHLYAPSQMLQTYPEWKEFDFYLKLQCVVHCLGVKKNTMQCAQCTVKYCIW